MTSVNVHPINEHSDCATLMWIGDHCSADFADAFQFCSSHVSQLALRANPVDAISRPAQCVRRIVLARRTRLGGWEDQWSQLTRSYPAAEFLDLQGSLLGIEKHPLVQRDQRCVWHQWQQVLPGWLKECGVASSAISTTPKSVAVVSASFAAADPLMDLIESCGLLAVWCRELHPQCIRGMQAVWWDDSAVGPSSTAQWRERMAACGANTVACQHIWIVNSPRVTDYQQAKEAGVSMVLGKPFEIDALAQTLTATEYENERQSRSLPQQRMRA